MNQKQGGWGMVALAVVGIAAFASLSEVTEKIGAAAIPIWLGAFVAGTILLRGPLGHALVDRIRGGGQPSATGELEVEELRARVAELEARSERMVELEERVDFAERLLAQRPGSEALPRGGNG